MSGRGDRLFQLLADLPRGNIVASDKEIRRHVMHIFAPAFFAAMKDAPRFKETHETKAAREIVRFARLCRDLGEHIKGMSATSIRAIRENSGPRARHPMDLLDDLVFVVEACRAAHADMETDGDAPAGAKGKAAAREVTAAAAEAFEAITGREPTITTRDGIAGGAFLEFLAAVFLELRINASPEAQAREWRKSRRAGAINSL